MRHDNIARYRSVETFLKWTLGIVLGCSVLYFAIRDLPKFLKDKREKSFSIEKESPLPLNLKSGASDVLKAIHASEWDKAIALIEAGELQAHTDVHRAELWNMRGVIEFMQDNNPDAVAWFMKSVKLDPSNASYFQNWGEAMRKEGYFTSAIEPMRKALALKPDDFILKVKWSLVLIEAGQEDAVVSEIKIAGKEGSLPAEWGFAKAALLEKNGKSEEAKDVLKELKENLPPEVYDACMSDLYFRPKT